MRVIAGEFRSRKLLSLPGLDTRPTPDRLRESLFSILTQRIEGSVFVDAYAGTGAVGIEAISRGARLAVFIESSRAAADVIRQNIASLKIESRSRLVRAEAAKSAAEMASADIVFADPPYTKEDEFAAFLNAVTAGCQALTIVQHPVRLVLAPEYGGFQRTRSFRQGDNALSFYEAIR
jgi:16S rRNA (guanine966-N2)-methyltransferase